MTDQHSGGGKINQNWGKKTGRERVAVVLMADVAAEESMGKETHTTRGEDGAGGRLSCRSPRSVASIVPQIPHEHDNKPGQQRACC